MGTAGSYDPAKNIGTSGVDNGGEGTASNDGAPFVGDPINASTGDKYLQEDDYLDNPSLTFRRFYNSSAALTSTAIGTQWRHSFDRSLAIEGNPATVIVMFRPDGSQETFTKANGVWTTALAYVDTLTETDNAQGVATGYTVFLGATRHSETYGLGGHLLTITDETGQTTTLTYNGSTGQLVTVTDPNNRQLSFTYDSNGHVHQITLPDTGTLTYGYDTNGNLVSVQYPDTKTRTYVYNEPAFTGGANLPNALTGIIDENGVRYANTAYNTSGLATSSSFMSTPTTSVETTQLTYNSNGTTTMLYPLGHSATMGFTQVNGLNRVGSIDQPCDPDCGQPWQTRTYDTNGYPASYTDFKGNLTTTQYNPYGLLHIEVDGSGTTNQRTTTTVWNGTLYEPLTRQVQNAQGTLVAEYAWAYNYLGEMNARCEIDPAVPGATSYVCSNATTAPAGVRQWGYSYCGSVNTTQCPVIGLLLSVNGPRTDVTDVTSYTYYMLDGVNHKHGDLATVTDPLGHVTTYLTYDGAGRVLTMQDANGVVTTLTYTPRGWLASRSVGGATTHLTYWPYGAVETVTDPDGVTTTFTYDGAHRLTDITDAQNNDIHYTLDASGNKTGEQVRTASGTVVKSLSRQYNTLGQLTAVIDGLSHTVFSASASASYDANGNLVNSVDALGYQRQQSFDALNRLSTTIANYNGADPATSNTTTQVTLDARDRLTGVTDPTLLNTTYTYDGLNNRTQLQSPDTGTSTDTFDAAGNRLVHTDAKGNVGTSTYDADNRLAGTSYADTTLNVTYKYDEANSVTGCSTSSPIGRLTRVVEASVTTIFCYDSRGNVIQKQQVTSSQTDTTLYTYTLANRLSGESTPDHTAISYAYDTDGRVSGVTVTPSGASTAPPTVVSNVTYMPFGPISGYTLGNGQTITLTYDANYRLTDLTSPALALHFARDLMGDINALGNAPGANPATETYSYDPLYRLNKVIESNGSTLESYTYNPTGDRLSKTTTGLAGGAYGYTTGTHQLASIGNVSQANDLDGNTTGSVIGANTYGYHYNDRSRLDLAQLNGQTVGTYTYNALGERIGKVAATTERYAYNEAGQLIGEYGTTNRDYIWLGGLPVAVIDNTINGSVTTSTVNYVTADQLGTPRVVTNSAGTVIWQWAYQGNPFGEQQPTSSSGYVLNLRYPGQYYDAESATNYNFLRNYNPPIGRFNQPDPIGLLGGISAFGYVDSNPLSYIDPYGLATVILVGGPAGLNLFGHVAIGFTGQGVYSYGTFDAFGSSVTEYLASQAGYRSTTAYILNTTPEQEQAMMNYIESNYSQPGQYSVLKNHDCASMVNGAMSQAGIGNDALISEAQAGGDVLPQLPATSALMASTFPGVQTVQIPQGGVVPASMNSFNPAQ